MPPLNYNHLYYFHVVASEGALAAAARRLNLAQPTISEQIKQLELTLGTRLFDRRPNLQLTAMGRLVFEHTRTMFRIGEHLLQRFPGGGEARSTLAMGITAGALELLPADLLARLHQLENVFMRVQRSDVDVLLRRLASHELDLVLSDVEPLGRAMEGLRREVVKEVPIVAVAAPVLANGGGVPELTRMPMLGYPLQAQRRVMVDEALAERNLVPPVIGETEDVAVQIAVALAGTAFAVVPQSTVAEALAGGRLVKLMDVGHERVWAVRHAEVQDAVVEGALTVLAGNGADPVSPTPPLS